MKEKTHKDTEVLDMICLVDTELIIMHAATVQQLPGLLHVRKGWCKSAMASNKAINSFLNEEMIAMVEDRDAVMENLRYVLDDEFTVENVQLNQSWNKVEASYPQVVVFLKFATEEGGLFNGVRGKPKPGSARWQRSFER